MKTRNIFTKTAAVAALMLAPVAARAGFTNVDTLGAGDAGRELANNTVYKVESDLTLTNTGTGPGLRVASDATTVLYIKKGVTLTVNGGNSSGRSAGDAGLRVLSGRTLVVTGGGKLVATGGNAAAGANGGDAGSCSLDMSGDSHGGQGGAGGNGGAGASAGIGGYGGYGGYGGSRPSDESWVETNDTDDYDRDGNNGNGGDAGGNGDDMGTVYLLGSLDVTATGGSGGSGGSSGGNTGGEHDSNWSGVNWYYVGGAGGGGGGAGGIAAPYAIGGGGGGGGGGGSGGNGGLYWAGSWGTGSTATPDGAGGQGGWDNGTSSSRTSPTTVGDKHGGYRGSGGAKGANGGNGTLYRDSGVTLNATYASATSATTHSAIEYSLTFSDGQRVNESHTARLGYAYPTAPIPPARMGWTFNGWFTEKDGGGVKYYNADGTATAVEWATCSDVTLYASWTTDPDAAASIWINGTPLVGGTSTSGYGWNYNGADGRLTLTATTGSYVITGKDETGEFSIYAAANLCTVVMSNLTMNASNTIARPPFESVSGKIATLQFEGVNKLTGCSGYPAIYVAEGSSVTIGGAGQVEATGGANAPGIGGAVGETAGTATLNIKGGTIVANGGDFGAGIGSAKDGGFGSITISGGIVKATGKGGTSASGGGAGIGGGAGASGGVIRITGGEVTAIGGNRGSGIGGGSSATGGDISISGGTVNATGGYAGAGIGGGVNGAGGTIAISGGTVTATGGSGASGIGGGDCGPGGTITISGGEVVARGSDHGAGIGGGRNKYGGTITITGGHVDAAGDTLGAGIGGGSGCNPGTITISGGFVKAVGGSGGCSGIGSGYDNYSYAGIGTVLISGGTIYASGSGASSDIGSGSNVENAIPVFTGGAIYVNDEKVSPHPKDAFEKRVFPVDLDIGLPNSLVTEFELGTRNSGFENIYTNDRGILRIWLASSIYSYGIRITMEDGSEHVFCFKVADDGKVTSSDFLIVNEAIITGDEDQPATEWTYTKSTSVLALLNNATVSGVSTSGTFRIVVKDDRVANLTLKDLTIVARSGKELSALVVSNAACTITLDGDNILAARGQYAAGIEVASNSVLTVKGDGSLTVFGGKNAAGIGSAGGFTPPGKIVIEGGTIVAQGGEKAAGIGGGVTSNLQADGIVISGGNVTATGGASAAGIGSGYMGGGSSAKTLADGAVKISGGTVLATRGANASSDLISSGNTISVSGYAKALCITGGSVHGANNSALPNPVDADGTSLRYWFFTGFEVGATPVFESGLPENYATNGIVADATGSVCLWLPATNDSRILKIDGLYFAGGGATNNVFSVDSASDDLPESIREDGKTKWRVTVPGLEANVAVTLDIEAGCRIPEPTSDSEGNFRFYVANGTYVFEANGLEYLVRVSEGPATAVRRDLSRPVGVLVNGQDISIALGDGWTFSCDTRLLSLAAAGPFAISGSTTNIGVRADADCAVTLDSLAITNDAVSLAPFDCAAHVVAMSLSGTNSLVSVVEGIPGLRAEAGASLAISNLSTFQPFNFSTLLAVGGKNAAGIGGGSSAEAGAIAIESGCVSATGGSGAAGIGGSGDGGTIVVSGGTVVARAGASASADIGVGGAATFTGGAIYSALGDVSPAASNSVPAAVYPVDFHVGTPGARVATLVIDEPALAYGATDLYADADGVLRLWLPDGRYFLDLGMEGGETERWVANIDGEDTFAIRYAPGDVGFTVNGTDVGEILGDGWHYDAVGGALSLTGDGPFELSGTLTNATVAIAANCAVTLSNAVVDASAVTDAGAIHLASGVTATLSLVGENAATGGVGRAGITVPADSALVIVDQESSNLSTSQPFNFSTLLAVGGAGAAGIGGDDNAAVGTIRILGGAISATGGGISPAGGAAGAGIGGGSYSGNQTCRIEISGGIVSAVSGGDGAYAIGAATRDGYFSSRFGHVSITGGTVFTAGNRWAAIGSGPVKASSDYDSLTITGGAVFADEVAVTPDAWSCGHERAYPVDFNIGRADSPVDAQIELRNGGGTVEYGMSDVRTDSRGIMRLWLQEGSSVVIADGVYWRVAVSHDGSTAERWDSNLKVNGIGVASRTGEGWTFDFAEMTLHLTGAGPFEITGEEPGAVVSVESDCEIVISGVTLATLESGPAAFSVEDGVSATLTLSGENSLAGGRYHPGLAIAKTASLVIRGDGSLAATGGEGGAGIGAGGSDSAGALTIEGGVIVAQGGRNGAGIGGGDLGSRYGSCGTIVISGGDVTAIGGGSAPGIGQTSVSSEGVGSILVSGGDVTATGGYGASGIGSCYYSVPVTISGGVVTATGGELGAGIGGGQCGSADVTISGGVMTATGGYHGAGIGGGEGSYGMTYSAGTVRISGGIVSATAGEGAHGIGGGYLSDRGSVEITGGTVAAAGGEGGMDVGIIGPSGVAGSVVFGGGSILADMAKVKPAAKNASGEAVWRVDVAVDNPDPARAVAVTGLDGYGVADIYPDVNGDIHLWLPDGTYDFEVDGTPVHEEVDGSSVFIPLGVAVDGVDVGHGSGPNWVLDDQKRIVLSGACVVSGTNTLDGLSIRFETSDEIVFSNACIRSQQGFAVATNVSAVVRGIGRNAVAPTYWPRLLEEGASFTVAGGTFAFRSEETFTILGGSVSGISTYYASPTNAAGVRVYCADLKGIAPGAAVGPLQGLPDYYDTSEIYADDAGEVHLWLPEGTYVATNAVDGAKWTIRIGPEGETTVVAWNDDFTVNGVNIAQLSGEGWDYTTNVLAISGTGRYTVRGTNELGGVRIVVASDATVELAGVSLRAEAPFALGTGVAATVLLNGSDNRLVATRSTAAGLFVPETAALTVSNATADAKLVSIGGGAAAGIGGNHGDDLRVGSITLAGGTVEAHSSETDDHGEAAAIGAGRGGKAGPIRITGGRVYAYAGSKYGYASAAIGGSLRMAEAYTGGLVEISGGTVYACGGRQDADVFASDIGDGLTYSQSYDNNVPVVITGGNVVLAHFDSEKERFTQSRCAVTNLAHDVAGRVLHAVVVPLGTPDAAVSLLVSRPSDSSEESSEVSYGTRDLYADASGDLYLWLPDGDYTFAIGETRWAATVAGADTVAQLVSPADPLGVFVNGVEVAHGTGDGWRYNAVSSRLTLTGDGPLVLSGTNTQGKVRVRVETEATVTLSNLCLKATANRNTPFAIVSNLAARVWFTGTNTLEAGRYCAALEVPGVSDLEIGGDGWLFANGGATSDYWGCPAIGISDGMYYEFQHQSVTITGGNIVALSGAVGTVGGIDDPVIAGGNIYIGYDSIGRYTLAFIGATTPQGEDASCIEIPGLQPNAPVVFSGLPAYYNASNIYANAEGKVYLHLPAQPVYDEEDYMFFVANGMLYRVVAKNSSAANTAERVTGPTALRIESIDVSDGKVSLVVSAEPDGWLTEATAPQLRVRAAAELPLPEGDAALLPREDVEISANGDGTATATVPRAADAPQMFYDVEAP